MVELTDEQGDEQAAFRQSVRTWLGQNFPSTLIGQGAELLGYGDYKGPMQDDASLWQQRLGAKGWGTPTWPSQYGGGGLDHLQARVLFEEMNRVGAFNPIIVLAGMGVTMVGPTILEYGTEDQKNRHLPPICRGEIRWCLGYSEPNAGSDLASLATKAEDKGDCWLVNGQKVWTSGADISQ